MTEIGEWAFNLAQLLDEYIQSMSMDLSNTKSKAVLQRLVDLKYACEEIQTTETERVAKTNLWVTRTAFGESFYQCNWDDMRASKLYVSIVFPFIVSLLEKIIHVSKETGFTAREFLQIMHGNESVIRPTLVDTLLPHTSTQCMCCGVRVETSIVWEVKRLKDTAVMEWSFCKECEARLTKVAKIYNLLHFISCNAEPFSIFVQYTTSLARISVDSAYNEFMTLIKAAENIDF